MLWHKKSPREKKLDELNDVVDSVEIMLLNVLKQQFCLVLDQFVYVVDVSGDTSPITWQRVRKRMFKPMGEGGSGR